MAGKKVIETLVTELTADGAKLKKEMDDSLKHAKSWGDKMTSIAKGVGAGLVAGGTALAASSAVLTKAAIDNADALFEQGQKLGMSTESLSAYQYAASMSGLETDKFNGYVNKLNKTIIDVAKGVGKGADAFDLLGVEVKDSEGNIRKNTEILNDLAEAFSRLPDTAGKAALAQDIFGKSGADLIPFLNNGSQGLQELTKEAERLNLVVNGKTAEEANKFNDELDKLGKLAEGAGNTLAEKALPSLLKLVEFLNDPGTQSGLGIFTGGLVDAGEAALKYAPAFSSLASVVAAIQGVSGSVDWFDKDELDAQEKSLARLVERAKMLYGEDFKADERFKYDPISDDIAKATLDLERYKKLKEMEAKVKTESVGTDKKLTAEDLIGNSIENEKDITKNWEVEQKREIALMLEREKKAQEAADREVLMQREKFAAIHEEMLLADEKVVDLENYRYKRKQEELQKEMDALNEKGLLTAELELEFQMAKEEQEAAHQDRLKGIKEKAHEEDLKRQQIELHGYESLFGSLGDILDSFGGRQSRARRLLLLAEKSAAIKSSTIAINEGIAKASSIGFPQNLGAMASVAAATAGIIGNIEAVGIAHGGLTNVSKEATYLLDKGERVVSPKQNKDLTDFLRSPNSGSVSRIEVINQIPGVYMEATAEQEGDTMRLILTAVDNKLRQDLSNGRGVWREAKERFGLSVKGAI